MDINELIKVHLIWIVPLITLGLTALTKLIYKRTSFTIEDGVDFGFGLSISSFLLLVINLSDLVGSLLLVGYVLLIFGLAIFINMSLWAKKTRFRSIVSVVLSFFVGFITLYVTILYIGGDLSGFEIA